MIAPFEVGDLRAMRVQNAQQWIVPVVWTDDYGQALKDGGPAFSCWHGDQVLGSAGLVGQWNGGMLAWAILSADAGRYFLEIHRAVLHALATYAPRRTEMAVQVGHDAAHRWARMLGFVREGTMRAWLPDGSDCDLYARVR